ncbi:MAG: NAD-dependent epimerase/dehydratase family protein [Nitrososphaerota archaeon]|nr:NAD-dependent epimerase/dehydratase family protein [Candidatus Bathyarchaeota archaeon]MDW8048505.1 NAD-dependent epimerase/dehydratase family protein [Nitrososphaerota archaeon]
MEVIVTGGCGFIGSNLVERLVREDHSVTVIDNLHTGSLKNIEGLDVKFYNEPYSRLREIVGGADVIFHLGIPSSSPMYRRNPRLVGEAINDAIEIFEFAKDKKCKVVYASSSSIYNGNPVPYREDMPIYVTDYYTECRYLIERLANLYNTLFGVKSVGLRLFSIYGPKEEFKGTYANIVSQFLWSMKKDEPPVIFGDGTQTRDFTYVGDVVEAFLLAWKKEFECEIFNVGTGKAYSFNEVVEILNRLLGKNLKPIYKPNPIKNYVERTLADTTKAEKLLGFKAKVSLEEGLRSLINA